MRVYNVDATPMNSSPAVSVVVSHHLDELRPYLFATLWALEKTEGVHFETILISDAETQIEGLAPSIQYVYDKALNSHSKKMEHGARIAKGDYLFFLSDDVMIARHTIARLLKSVIATQGIVSPFGQAEHFSSNYPGMPKPKLTRPGGLTQYGLYDTEALALVPDMRLEDVSGWHMEIVNRPPGPDVLIQKPWVPFYAPMMPKQVFEKVGDFDPSLDSRHNDQDFCYRAGALGIPSVFDLGAPVLHFGSKTLEKSYTQEQMNECTAAMMQKYQTYGRVTHGL